MKLQTIEDFSVKGMYKLNDKFYDLDIIKKDYFYDLQFKPEDLAEVKGTTGRVYTTVMDKEMVGDIGVQGEMGFGVGVSGILPVGMENLEGNWLKIHDNYGNYKFGHSVLVCVPTFYYRWGHVDSPRFVKYGANALDVLPFKAYASVAAANADGFALHRSFYDDGLVQPCFFVDKYQCSNKEGVAHSVKFGDPLSGSNANNPQSALNGSPSNAMFGTIQAAKTRGEDFFPKTIFIDKALALLSMAQAQATSSVDNCAWYDPAGVTNYPKGCNNNALRDANDLTVLYEGTGYLTAGKTGSGTPFAKTTHNGQKNGVADLNGNMWEVALGLTQLAGNFYILKPETRAADLTAGITLETDAWGELGLAKNYDVLGESFGEMSGVSRNFIIGSSTQVFSGALVGLEWQASCAGIPQLGGGVGSNIFGNDRFYDNRVEHLSPITGGGWGSGADAGVGTVHLNNSRSSASYYIGFRSALYPVSRSDSEA